MPETFIRVKPAHAGSNLSHPAGGRPLPAEGGLWPDDGFTHRRIVEGGVIRLPDEPQIEADKPAPAAPAAVKVAVPAANAPLPGAAKP